MGRRHSKGSRSSDGEDGCVRGSKDNESSRNKPKKKSSFGVMMLLEKIQNSKKISAEDKQYLLGVLNLDERSKVLLKKRMMIFNEIMKRVAKSKDKSLNKKMKNKTKRHKSDSSYGGVFDAEWGTYSSSDDSSKKQKKSKKRTKSNKKRKKRRKAKKKHKRKSSASLSSISLSSLSDEKSTDQSSSLFKLENTLGTGSKETSSESSHKIKSKKKLEKSIKLISKKNKELFKKINKSLEHNRELLKRNLKFMAKPFSPQHHNEVPFPQCHSRSVHFVEKNIELPKHENKSSQVNESLPSSETTKKNDPLDPVQINYIVLTPPNVLSTFKKTSSLPSLENIGDKLKKIQQDPRHTSPVPQVLSKQISFDGSECLSGQFLMKILPKHKRKTMRRYYNDHRNKYYNDYRNECYNDYRNECYKDYCKKCYNDHRNEYCDDYLGYDDVYDRRNKKKTLVKKKKAFELLREDIHSGFENLANNLMFLKNNRKSPSNAWDEESVQEVEEKTPCRLYDCKYAKPQNSNKCSKNNTLKDKIFFKKSFPNQHSHTSLKSCLYSEEPSSINRKRYFLYAKPRL